MLGDGHPCHGEGRMCPLGAEPCAGVFQGCSPGSQTHQGHHTGAAPIQPASHGAPVWVLPTFLQWWECGSPALHTEMVALGWPRREAAGDPQQVPAGLIPGATRGGDTHQAALGGINGKGAGGGRSCGGAGVSHQCLSRFSIPASARGQAGCSSEQPGLVEVLRARDRGHLT